VLATDLVLCLLSADFISGVVHWAEDTYAVPGMSKFLDRHVVLPNLEHHRSPGLIAGTPYWSNSAVSMTLGASAALVLATCGVRDWQPYFTLLLVSQANQTHAWAHTTKVPRLVALLQRTGLIQSVDHHAEHHRKPYMVKYCTMTNFLNPLLDRIGFWRGIEALIPVPVRRGGKERRYL
jgi:hypothetical protein